MIFIGEETEEESQVIMCANSVQLLWQKKVGGGELCFSSGVGDDDLCGCITQQEAMWILDSIMDVD